MADGTHDDLVRDLASLGRGIARAAPSDRLAAAVMDRVAALPPPHGRPAPGLGRGDSVRTRVATTVGTGRRRIALVVAAVVLALLAAPPVRAAVADWFGFGGVLVERAMPVRDGSHRRPRWRPGQLADRGRGSGRLHGVGAG